MTFWSMIMLLQPRTAGSTGGLISQTSRSQNPEMPIPPFWSSQGKFSIAWARIIRFTIGWLSILPTCIFGFSTRIVRTLWKRKIPTICRSTPMQVIYPPNSSCSSGDSAIWTAIPLLFKAICLRFRTTWPPPWRRTIFTTPDITIFWQPWTLSIQTMIFMQNMQRIICICAVVFWKALWHWRSVWPAVWSPFLLLSWCPATRQKKAQPLLCAV